MLLHEPDHSCVSIQHSLSIALQWFHTEIFSYPAPTEAKVVTVTDGVPTIHQATVSQVPEVAKVQPWIEAAVEEIARVVEPCLPYTWTKQTVREILVRNATQIACGCVGPYHSAECEYHGLDPTEGTFQCPICGLDSPHEHTGEEIAKHRGAKEAKAQPSFRERVRAGLIKNRVIVTPTLQPWMEAREIQENTCAAHVTADLTAENERLAKDAESWKHHWKMYRDAWVRELGGWTIPKAHEIDSLVLTTRKRCVNPLLGNCNTPHWLGKPTQDRKALTQTLHPCESSCREWKADDSEPNPRAEAAEAELTALRASFPKAARRAAEQINETTDEEVMDEFVWEDAATILRVFRGGQ
jgi:hypothetical protein